MEENNKVTENGGNGNVALKVIGIMVGILAAIILLSYIFSKTLLPLYRYNSAEKLAAEGDYATAALRLERMEYKDSLEKYEDYSFKAGEEYYESGDMDKAADYFIKAYNVFKTTDISDKCIDYLMEIKPELFE